MTPELGGVEGSSACSRRNAKMSQAVPCEQSALGHGGWALHGRTWRLARPFAVNLVTGGLCPSMSDGSGVCHSATLLLPAPASLCNCELMAMQEGS